MPRVIPIQISNLYGPVKATELSNIKLYVSFGHIALADISGYLSITSRYSKMTISRALGALQIQAEKSGINADGIDAMTSITREFNYNLSTTYSDITIASKLLPYSKTQ